MKSEQKIAAVGAAGGVLLMVSSVWILTGLLPQPLVPDAIGEHLGYALKANAVALVPVFVMLVSIGSSRFLSEAIAGCHEA